jgi:[citrate (pro-3S)-lyase] ligase
VRLTPNTPLKYSHTVFVFGDGTAFGIGTEDKFTIASLLQESINDLLRRGANVQPWRVVNEGLSIKDADDEYILENKIKPMMKNGEIKRGDAVLWIQNKRWTFTEDDKIRHSYLAERIRACGARLMDLSRTLEIAQKQQAYVDDKHVNHRGYKAAASKIFIDYLRGVVARDAAVSPDYKGVAFAEAPSLDEERDAEFRNYLDYLAKSRADAGGLAGAVVMNCNPFTLGHRYLVERAAHEVDILYVFVVEEDRSFFPFEDRFRLVEEGLSDLKNVKALRGGKFIISTVTFPEYFAKDSAREVAIDASLDLELFVRYIAPVLGIETRFAGSEPLDPVTAQYNRAMREKLPSRGVRFVEFERILNEGEPISASRVRALLEEKNFNAVRALTPDVTYNYLARKFAL